MTVRTHISGTDVAPQSCSDPDDLPPLLLGAHGGVIVVSALICCLAAMAVLLSGVPM
ncbi:hypothetical protein ACWDTI_21130 [Gordonia sp. NPDC003424]